MISISFIGRLTSDVETKQTASGQVNCRFSVAVDKQLNAQKRQELQQAGQPTADFLNCVAFGKTAENLSAHYKKGDVLFCTEANFSTNKYTAQDGSTKTGSNFVVNRYVPAYELVSKRQAQDKLATNNQNQNGNGFQQPVQQPVQQQAPVQGQPVQQTPVQGQPVQQPMNQYANNGAVNGGYGMPQQAPNQWNTPQQGYPQQGGYAPQQGFQPNYQNNGGGFPQAPIDDGGADGNFVIDSDQLPF